MPASRQLAGPTMRPYALLLASCLGLLAACLPTRHASEAPPVDPAPEPSTAAVQAHSVAPAASLDRAAFRELTGRLTIDGSSTVFPITEAIVEVFESLAPEVSVRLGVSGTGGGFEKFCRGETDISNASRPIKPAEERLCADHGIRFVELPVAFDGLSVVVHGDNTWLHCLTTAELKRLWSPEAETTVRHWNALRPSLPDRPIRLYAPGRDSGTFDYFTRAIVGAEGSSRGDFVGSEDDYLLAQDIAADPDALGFFGYAYYREYRHTLNPVAIDPGSGCVAPSVDSITSGQYRPLSRPIFIYVAAAGLDRPALRGFLDVYLAEAPRRVAEIGYVPLPLNAYGLARQRIDQRRTGSVFDGGSQVGLSIEVLLGLAADDIDLPAAAVPPKAVPR